MLSERCQMALDVLTKNGTYDNPFKYSDSKFSNVEKWSQNPLYDRWFLEGDMNCDGISNYKDLMDWLGSIIFTPADSILFFIMKYLPGLANFFEITPKDYAGPIAFGIMFGSTLILLLLSCVFYLGKNQDPDDPNP